MLFSHGKKLTARVVRASSVNSRQTVAGRPTSFRRGAKHKYTAAISASIRAPRKRHRRPDNLVNDIHAFAARILQMGVRNKRVGAQRHAAACGRPGWAQAEANLAM